MGQDKALLRLAGGETLMEHTIAVCAAVSPEVKIVGPHERYATFSWAAEFVHDQFEGCGPLGGIHAALQNTQTDLNLIVAVDMPQLTSDLLAFIVRKVIGTDALAVVPRVAQREQPLCAVYRRGFLELAAQSLQAGKYKIGALFRPETTLIIEESELQQHGFAAALFSNTNTPEDWQQVSGSI